MNTREKVLVGLMATAVLGGAVTMLGRSKPASTVIETPEQAKQRAAASIQASRSRLRMAAPNEAVLTVELQQRAPWQINPFAHGTVDSVQSVHRDSVSYGGYLVLGGERRAVLNGRAYAVGDVVVAAGVRVVTIRPDEVVVVGVDTGKRETVQLEKPKRERGQ